MLNISPVFLMPTQMAPRKSGVTRATSKKYTKRKRNTEASVLDIGESSDVIAQGEIPPPQHTKKRDEAPEISDNQQR